MASVVFFHAHPDDEASQTSGAMVRLVREGHRVIVVYGTGGEHGTRPAGLTDDGSVAAYRRGEAEESALILGTSRVAWLGYLDSGMHGWAHNAHHESFHSADLDEAARRLAGLLDEEDAAALVIYDSRGGYGHPDHIKVHRVGHREAELARQRPRVLESTMNRDDMRRGYEAAVAAGMDLDFDPTEPMPDGEPMGMPEKDIHYRVDVSADNAQRREALAAHASQEDVQGMLAMPADMFAAWFNYEYYVEPGREPGMIEAWPFADMS